AILKTDISERSGDRPIGVIAIIGPAALSFMLRARPELWPDVPAIFASVDPETAAQAQIPVGVTGLVRRQTVRDSVSVARALMPNLKRIALVGDRLGRQNFRRHFEEEIPLLAAEVGIIPVVAGNFVRPVFDWRELRRWNVSEDRLPAGSDVLFRQPSLWEQHKWQLIAGVALLGIQGAFIVVLLENRRRARRAHADLLASEQRVSLAADA